MIEIPLHDDNNNYVEHDNNAKKTRRRNYLRVLKKFAIVAIATSIFLIFVVRFELHRVLQLGGSDITLYQTTTKAVVDTNKGERVASGSSNTEQRNSNLGQHDSEIQFKPLVISGPSGVGKGTLINKLIDHYNHKIDQVVESNEFQTNDMIHGLFGFSVSHTTRSPRPGEVNGVHYHFSNREDMLKGIERNEFVEYAEVHGNLYGTSFEAVQNVISSERICILDIDVQGAKRVKENTNLIKDPYFIFIAPPSIEQLEERLRGRGTETEEAIERRIGNARSEIDYGTKHGNFDRVIVNDNLEIAFVHLRQILEEWYPHLNQIPSPSYEF